MKPILWNDGWTFSDTKPSFGANEQTPITLPHDALISTETFPEAPGASNTGFYGGSLAVYNKVFDAPEAWKGQKVMLHFDGSYMNTEVAINGHLVTIHHYGYTPFTADLTPYLYFHRPNRVEVVVNNTAQPNSRWYTGTGLYRDVTLLTSPLLHIAHNGIYAYTDHLQDGTAYVMTEITVVNNTIAAVNDWVKVSISNEAGEELAANTMKYDAEAGAETVVRVPLIIRNAPIWDTEDPKLCCITASVGEDNADTTFGIRTLTWDIDNGLQLNGRTIKLKGGCVHHDNGTLGAASFHDSEYRKMKFHKGNGYNAIRTAHNPPSTAMLDACDKLGLLVMDEAFDAWRIGKVTNDYHLYFDTDWEADITAQMLRDRNHPSVIMWSTGNEINERAGLSNGFRIARQLADKMRQLDPTRPVTNGICSLFCGLDDELMDEMRASRNAAPGQNVINSIDARWAEITEAFAAPLDIVGYNYYHNRYAEDGKRFPNRIMVGSESAPLRIADIWSEVEAHSYVVGDFTWTSYDYLGESGIGRGIFVEKDTDTRGLFLSHNNAYPWRVAMDADFDICGFDRPQLHYRKIVWGDDETYIFVHDPAGYDKKEVLSIWSWYLGASHWSWNGYEGKPIKVTVYSRGEEVKLFHNGTCIGTAVPEKFMAAFDTIYTPGTLTAISYVQGVEISRHEVATTGVPIALRCTAETGAFKAGEQSLAFVTIEAVDADGNRVPWAEIPGKATVTGEATLQAFASARAKTTENYTTGSFTSYEGRWQAVLRSGSKSGQAVLRIEAEGLPCAEIALDVE